jgi:predicted small secreted protein
MAGSAERRRACIVAVCAALLAGCAQERGPGSDAAAAGSAADSAQLTRDPDVRDIARRHFDAVPDSMLVRRGACPFECCVYGEWRADTTIPVMAEVMDSGVPAFELQRSERFQAVTGEVHITGPAIVVVDDTVVHGATTLVPGDTLVVLDYTGEGHFNMLHDGTVLESVAGFWGAEHDAPKGTYLGDYAKEWWVSVRNAQGRTGWFRADTTYRFSGANACGGPMR